MESHGDKSNPRQKGSLSELSNDELFERLMQANHSTEENKQSLTEYVNEEEDKHRPDVSGNDSTENLE